MRIILNFVSVSCGVMLVFLAYAGGADANEAGFEQTCKYYRSISFNDRHTRDGETLNVRLANDCAAALDIFRSQTPDTEALDRTAAYLAQLEAYRAVLVAMARDRFAAQRQFAERGGAALVARPVSRTGAYLIAQNMGLLERQGTWRAWQQAQVR